MRTFQPAHLANEALKPMLWAKGWLYKDKVDVLGVCQLLF